MSEHRYHWVCAVGLVGTGALSLGVVSPEELEANKPQLEISENANNLLIDWEAHPEVYYFVEGSPDLSEDSWVTAKLLKDNAGSGNLSLGTAITGSQGFYRLSQEGDPNAARLSADDDNDGISNRLEADAGMDAFSPEIATDSDNDGLPDYWETFYFTSLTTTNGSGDSNQNGLTDTFEWLNRSNPTNPEDTESLTTTLTVSSSQTWNSLVDSAPSYVKTQDASLLLSYDSDTSWGYWPKQNSQVTSTAIGPYSHFRNNLQVDFGSGTNSMDDFGGWALRSLYSNETGYVEFDNWYRIDSITGAPLSFFFLDRDQTENAQGDDVTFHSYIWDGESLTKGGQSVTFGEFVRSNYSSHEVDGPLIHSPILADYNRVNGFEPADKNQATTRETFYFWINDDDDENTVGGHDIPEAAQPDYANATVDGMRDLVDFFPLWINFDDLSNYTEIDSSDTVEIKLSGSSLKYIDYTASFLNDYGERIADYLEDNEVAEALSTQSTVAVSGSSDSPTTISVDFIENLTGAVFPLLFEGVDNGNLPVEEPLTVEIYLNGTKFYSLSIPLRLDHVENMYHHVDLTGYTGDNPNKGTTPAESTNTDAPNWPDEQVNEKTFVFIHGYNVNDQAARGWNAEVFKRMHQLGSNARFVGVTWDGDVAPDYHNAVYRAFQTSAQVAGELSAYSNLTVAAHSLGNIVVSNAMARHGFNPDNYYLLNATTPIESYDSSQTENSSNNADMNEYMTEIDWKNYPDRLLAANWYDLFAPGDARRGLTWKDRFPGVATVGHNFYSPGEDVVENARPDENVSQSAWNALVNWATGGNIGTHAWVTQEIAKGGKSLLVTEFTLSELHGGWDFNGDQGDLEQVGILKSFPPDTDSYRPRLASETSATVPTDEQLAQFGFFKRFNELGLYAPIDDANAISGVTQTQTQASIAAGDDDMQWHLLAEAIPAMSFAAAANEVLGMQSNIDMETKQNGWPQARLNDPELGSRWLHSDFKNVSLNYVYLMYEEMIRIGELDDE